MSYLEELLDLCGKKRWVYKMKFCVCVYFGWLLSRLNMLHAFEIQCLTRMLELLWLLLLFPEYLFVLKRY